MAQSPMNSKAKEPKKSDGSVLKITDDGVTFRSYRNGEKILLTPERSIAAQKAFGADIIIPFDELPPYHIDDKSLECSLHRTHEWEKRSLNTHLENPQNQAMYAVVHGGCFTCFGASKALFFLRNLPFDGFCNRRQYGKDKARNGRYVELHASLITRNSSKPPARNCRSRLT